MRGAPGPNEAPFSRLRSQPLSSTIIGGEVNLAARLEAMASPGGILLANETYQLVKNWVTVEEADTIHVKGISRPVVTYRLSWIYDE